MGLYVRHFRVGIVFAAAAAAWTGVFLASSSGREQRVTIGHSLRGQPIEIMQVGSGKGPLGRQGPGRSTKAVFLQAQLHGNEPAGAEFLTWLRVRIRSGEGPIARMVRNQGVVLHMLDAANPDGVAEHSRNNQRGVNLNRNFPVLWGLSREFPGSGPASEPEVASVSKHLGEQQYLLAIDLHGYVPWVVLPSPGIGKDSAAHSLWHQMVKRTTTGVLGSTYEIKFASGLGDGGAFEDYAFWQAKIPALCLEMVSEVQDKTRAKGWFVRYERFIATLIDELQADRVAAEDSLLQLLRPPFS